MATLKQSQPLPSKQLFSTTFILTVVIEAVACLFRFGLKMESTRDTASILRHVTCGYRIHHGYLGGVIMVAAGIFWNRNPRLCSWLLAIGFSLLLSDLIHHFLVLWPITGSPQFDFVYPNG